MKTTIRYPLDKDIEIYKRKRQLKILAEQPSDLKKVLLANEDVFLSRQEKIIENVFRHTADLIQGIKKRKIGELEDLRKAMKIFDEKELYLKKYNKESLSYLPDKARELIQREWGDAERVIKKYGRLIDFPIRFVDLSDRKIISMPFYVDSESETPRKLYNSLLTLGAEMQEKYNIETSQIKCPFGAIILKGLVNMRDIEIGVCNSFDYVKDSFGLNINPFYTNYYFRFGEDTNNPEQWLLNRIRELGYNNAYEFTRKTGIDHHLIIDFKNGLIKKSGKKAQEKMENFAKSLEVEESLLEQIIGGL